MRALPASWRKTALLIIISMMAGASLTLLVRGEAFPVATSSPVGDRAVPADPAAQEAAPGDDRADREPDHGLIQSFLYPHDWKTLIAYSREIPTVLQRADVRRFDDPERQLAHLVARHVGPYPSPDDVDFAFLPVPEDTFFDPRYRKALFKANVNMEILLDASGSMNEDFAPGGGKSKWTIALQELETFLTRLPPNVNVALRVFGHHTGPEAEGCLSSELLLSFAPKNAGAIMQAAARVVPAGFTPLAYALNQAEGDFAGKDAADHANFVFVLTDGMETCGGDPVAEAQALKASRVEPLIHIIGLGVNATEDAALRSLAQSVDAIYARVENLTQLQEQMDEIMQWAKMWDAWRDKAKHDLWMERLTSSIVVSQFTIAWDKAEEQEVEGVNGELKRLLEAGELDRTAYDTMLSFLERRVKRVRALRDEARAALDARRLAIYDRLTKLSETKEAMIEPGLGGDLFSPGRLRNGDETPVHGSP
ncbi:VWA domain-containing protein [Hydrogenibacillus schlegelii]|uniref:VWA domain-containing protein n=1 Tax=Hydrogenibacillus schlegelii TaxID=1484 RepID=UPI0012E8285B